MKKLRWQLVILVSALIAIGLLLMSQQPTQEQTTSVQPTTGGIYSEALIGAFGRLNPVLDYYNSPDRDIDRLLFRGLIRFDSSGLPQGDLAESWGVSQDGKVYNFSIRSNAVFHDGQPVTSQDIIFTIDLLRNDNIPIPNDQKEFWRQIEVNQLDEHTLQFRLPEPFAPFLDYLTFGILPYHLLSKVDPANLANDPFNLNPVGNGPYRFESLVTEDGLVSSVTLRAFDEFHLGRPFIDQVVFRYYPNSKAALTAYRNGGVLGISQVSDSNLSEVLDEPNLNLYTGRLPNLTLVYLNLDNSQLPFFQESAIRRAMLMGINRQKIIDRILNSQAILAHGPILPGTWAYYENIESIGYDPEKALTAIKNAGYTIPAEGGTIREKEGTKFSFELLYPDNQPYQAIAESIKNDWGVLGIEVNLRAMPFDELLQNHLETRDYQAALATINLSRFPDPDPYPFWDQAQVQEGQNYSMWNDRQASEFIENARINIDLGERKKAYYNFQVRFTTDMPALPLYYPVYSYAVDEQVKEVRIGSFYDPSDRFNNILQWFLVAMRPAGGGGSTPTP
jgi:peptide/nickel transport system substrate-binding protein